MIMFKDYNTGKKSITISGLIVTFILTVLSIIINLWLMVEDGREPFPAMTWTCIGLFSVFAGLYWNKRFRASKDGIELLEPTGKEECKNG